MCVDQPDYKALCSHKTKVVIAPTITHSPHTDTFSKVKIATKIRYHDKENGTPWALNKNINVRN